MTVYPGSVSRTLIAAKISTDVHFDPTTFLGFFRVVNGPTDDTPTTVFPLQNSKCTYSVNEIP